jgi:hypothetical protein
MGARLSAQVSRTTEVRRREQIPRPTMAYNFHTRANLVRRDFRSTNGRRSGPLRGLPMRSEQHQVGKVGCAGMIADEHLPTRSESTEAC